MEACCKAGVILGWKRSEDDSCCEAYDCHSVPDAPEAGGTLP